MTEPKHTAQLKVWFTSAVEAERFVSVVDRSSWAWTDPHMEIRIRAKIVTVTSSNAQLVARIAYQHASWKLGRGFVTKIEITGGPS